MSEAHKSHIVLAVGTILFVPLVQLQLRADIITQIGGDTRNFTILYTGGAGSQLHLSQGTITGNIGVGGTGTVKADGSGTINGNVDFSASNTGQFSITPSKTLNGSVNYSQTDVTNDLTSISNFSSAVGAEAGFSLGAINLASERLAARDPQDRVVKSRLFRAYMVGRRFPEAERLIDSMMEQTC